MQRPGFEQKLDLQQEQRLRLQRESDAVDHGMLICIAIVHAARQYVRERMRETSELSIMLRDKVERDAYVQLLSMELLRRIGIDPILQLYERGKPVDYADVFQSCQALCSLGHKSLLGWVKRPTDSLFELQFGKKDERKKSATVQSIKSREAVAGRMQELMLDCLEPERDEEYTQASSAMIRLMVPEDLTAVEELYESRRMTAKDVNDLLNRRISDLPRPFVFGFDEATEHGPSVKEQFYRGLTTPYQEGAMKFVGHVAYDVVGNLLAFSTEELVPPHPNAESTAYISEYLQTGVNGAPLQVVIGHEPIRDEMLADPGTVLKYDTICSTNSYVTPDILIVQFEYALEFNARIQHIMLHLLYGLDLEKKTGSVRQRIERLLKVPNHRSDALFSHSGFGDHAFDRNPGSDPSQRELGEDESLLLHADWKQKHGEPGIVLSNLKTKRRNNRWRHDTLAVLKEETEALRKQATASKP